MSDRRIRTLRISWLEAFIAVARLQNYSEAARQLECDQSTVSRYLIRLQSWMRKELVTGYVPTVLTPEGEEFLPKAEEICRLLRESRGPDPALRPKIDAKSISVSSTEIVSPPAPSPISAAHIDMSFWKKKPNQTEST